MGRKGGGRAGFLKAARHAHDSEGEEEQQQPKPAAAKGETSDAAVAAAASLSPFKAAQPSAKASKFLNEEPGAGDGSGDEDEEGSRRVGGETRGQVQQRHKREQKALKDQIKRMGKKAKDEAIKLEEEMEKQHATELAAFDAPRADAAEAVALAGSLYGVHLGEGEEHKPKKPTKSQKRKEQRATRDAEREARIAAELAELGDTERVLEQRALRRQLRPLGLTMRDIPPDGHCLYRSLEDQLQCGGAAGEGAAGAGGGSAGGGEGEGDAEVPTFLELRAAAAEYMRAHAEHFMPFVLEEGAAEGSPEEAFEAYCRNVEMTAAWGGQPELQALSHVLKAHILVHSVGMPVLEIGEEFKGKVRTLRLCYLRHAYGLGEHYNSVGPGIAVSDEEEEEEEEEDGSAAEGGNS